AGEDICVKNKNKIDSSDVIPRGECHSLMDAWIKFENEAGEDIFVKNQIKIKIDSFYVGPVQYVIDRFIKNPNKIKIDSSYVGPVHYFIDESEYELQTFIDGKEQKSELIEVRPNFDRSRFETGASTELGFSCWKRHDDDSQGSQEIVCDCFLSCPKLFGDNKKHKMSLGFWSAGSGDFFRNDYVIIDDVKFYTQNEWPYHVNVVL
ncbi:MAG: hypothetical protein RR499_06955, partial [Mucinivorans sp.]